MNNELIRIHRKLAYWKNLLEEQLPSDIRILISDNLNRLQDLLKESWKNENFSDDTIKKIHDLERKLNCLSEDSRKVSWN